MIEFKIVQEWEPANLVEEVNKYLSEGWNLHGQIMSFTERDEDKYICQAMTREKS